MFFPELFRKNSFDDFFDRAFLPMPTTQNMPMKTDIKETDTSYELAIDLPGIQKENVNAELHDGCLVVRASTAQNHDEQDEKGNYIRRERFSGSYSRSFYIGDAVAEEDIQAKFSDGVLNLVIPKKENTAPEKKYIPIS